MTEQSSHKDVNWVQQAGVCVVQCTGDEILQTHTHICSGPGRAGLLGNIPRQVFVIQSMNKHKHADTHTKVKLDPGGCMKSGWKKKEEKLNHVMEFFCFIRSCEIMSGNVLIFKNSDIDRHRGINDTQFNNLNILRNLMARLCFSFQALFFFFFFKAL